MMPVTLPETISVLFPLGAIFPMKRPQKSVTIHDVAEAAGVSVSTVSRVLNNKDDVALNTIQKVQDIIQEMGYVSSLAARGMRSHHTKMIGLVMPDVASPYCIEVLQGVNRAISQLDYDLIVYTNGDVRKYNTANQERYYVALLNGSITDGAIVVTPAATTFTTTAPLVAIDPNNESPEYPAVISTNYQGAIQAMDYLIDLGHRRIGFITGRLDLVSAHRRLEGYKHRLQAAGILLDNDLIQVGDYTTEKAVECTQHLLSLDNPPTAIFASNDMSAMGIYQVAESLGVKIPQALSVIGFDNLRETLLLNPQLTTINQCVSEMGSIAVEMIVKLVNGESLAHSLHKIQTQLVVRDSCMRMA
jgi:LacI family transcriptional regulator